MPASPTLAKARPLDLFSIFENVLGRFAFLACDYMGQPVEGPADLPLECRLRLKGPALGTLVLRCHPSLGAMLSLGLKAESHEAGPEEGRDAFYELCNQFCGHLCTELWDSKTEPFEGFLPEASQPSQWPLGDPLASCALLVAGQPMEIRLWLGAGE